MCDCNGDKNQTPKEAFEFAAKKTKAGIDHRRIIGAGLFLIPDPESGPLEFKKVWVDGLSYKEAIPPTVGS